MTSRSRRKSLILHIGDYKTGSTSLQMALAQGRIHLTGHSLCYPATLNHNNLKPLLAGFKEDADPAKAAKAQDAFQSLAAQIKAADADVTILSGEALEATTPDLLQKIIDRYLAPLADDIKIIAYVRPHAGRILSSYVERVKIGVHETLQTSLEGFAEHRMATGGFCYHPRFSGLRAQFGDRFILRPMVPDALYQRDVIADFLHHALPGIDAEIKGDTATNESPNLADLMRLKVLQNHLPRRRQLRHAAGWEFGRILSQYPAAKNAEKLQLHRKLAKALQAHYLADARALDRDFFAGRPLMEQALAQAVKKARTRAQALRPQDHFDAAELRSLRLMSVMVANTLHHNSPQWPKIMQSWRLDPDAPALLHKKSS